MNEIKEISLNNDTRNNYINFINRYRGHATDLKSFDWQFNHIPEKVVVVGLLENDTVLGSQCMMPIKVSHHNEEIISGKCENSYLDESLRGKGAFKSMFDFATDLCTQKDYELLWAFTPALKPYSRLGFDVYKNCLRETFLWFSIPSIGNYFKNRKGKAKILGIFSYLFACLTAINVSLRNALAANDGLESLPNSKSQNDLTQLQAAMRTRYNELCQISYTAPYLNWRIESNPNIKAENIYLYKNEELVGHIILSVKEERAVIYSLIYADPNNIKSIIFHLITALKKRAVTSLVFQGNYENEFNKNIFDQMSSLNLRGISTQGWDFVFKHSPKKANQKKISPENLLVNYLWTEGYG